MKAIHRVLQIAEYKGLKPTRFEKEIGLSNGYLGTQKKRNANLGEDVLLKIIDNCREINPEWLLTGQGEMLKSTSKPTTQEDTGKLIPMIPIDAMAGWGAGDVQVMDYDIQQYVVPEFNELKVDFMIRVKGSSMYPKYNSGDIVACKKLPLDTFFQWNKVYVLDTVQGAMIKRIKKSTLEENILCISDNTNYDPFELPLEEVHSLALVVGVIRLE